MRLVCVLLTSFLCALSLQGSSWISVGPDGGRVHALAADPVNAAHLLAGTDAGVFETVDAGTTWRRILSQPRTITHVAFDPAIPSILYAADDQSVYRSSDGGVTWTSAVQTTARTISTLELDAAGNVYAALACKDAPAPNDLSNPAFERSNDHGATFVPGGTGLGLTAGCLRGITPDPERPGSLYAHYWAFDSWNGQAFTGGWRSTDGGTTFSADATVPGRTLLVHPATKRRYAIRGGGTQSEDGWFDDGGVILVSDDAGATWRSISTGLPLEVAAIAIDAASANTVYAAAHDGLYVTTNLGVTWQKTLDVPSYAVVNAGGRLYAGTASGVFVSSDGGGKWSALPLRDAAAHVREIAIDPNRPATMVAWVEDDEQPLSFARSTDGGRTWERLALPVVFRTNPACVMDFCEIVVQAEVPVPDMAFDGGGNFYALLGSSLARLRAGAAAWEIVDLGSPSFLLVADPQSSGTLYIAGNVKAVRRSVDVNGVMTFIDSLVDPKVVPSSIAIDPVDPRTVFVGTVDGMARTADGGATWSIDSGGCGVHAISFSPVNHRVGWRLSCQGVERSADGGATWTAFPNPIPQPAGILADADDPSAALVWSSADGVERTTDGGLTWHSFNDGLATLDVHAVTASPQALYAAPFRAGVFTRLLQRRRAVGPR